MILVFRVGLHPKRSGISWIRKNPISRNLWKKRTQTGPRETTLRIVEHTTVTVGRAHVVASGSSSSPPRYLSELLRRGTLTGMRDGELLERFAARRDADDNG